MYIIMLKHTANISFAAVENSRLGRTPADRVKVLVMQPTEDHVGMIFRCVKDKPPTAMYICNDTINIAKLDCCGCSFEQLPGSRVGANMTAAVCGMCQQLIS